MGDVGPYAIWADGVDAPKVAVPRERLSLVVSKKEAVPVKGTIAKPTTVAVSV
jgi:hypothetical protein